MKILIDVEKIIESDTHAMIPVQVLDDKGEPLFESPKPVAIRLKFYRQMRTAKGADKVNRESKNPRWKDELLKICLTRILPQIKKPAESITYEDKRKLME